MVKVYISRSIQNQLKKKKVFKEKLFEEIKKYSKKYFGGRPRVAVFI